jgi:hypothetical protein
MMEWSPTQSSITTDVGSSTRYEFYNVHQSKKTKYPQLVLPELDLTDDSSRTSSGSSDEENSVQREKYSNKVDQDVAVFLMIAEKLSVTSLVHLLQGHVRSQQYHTWHYDTINAIQQEKEQKKLIQIEQNNNASDCNNGKKKRKKSFRFATIRNGEVRTIVHEIESIRMNNNNNNDTTSNEMTDCDDQQDYVNANDIWWSPTDMMTFRLNAIETVKHYRKYRKKYIQAIETIVTNLGNNNNKSEDSTTKTTATMYQINSKNNKNNSNVIDDFTKMNSQNVDIAMKVLRLDSFARGLETHICIILSKTRLEMLECILEEQMECKQNHDSDAIRMESIRLQSLAYSTSSVKFANLLGQVDHIEALQAMMSSWTPEL